MDQAETSSDQKESCIETQVFFLLYILLHLDLKRLKCLPVENMQAQEATNENMYNSVVVFA